MRQLARPLILVLVILAQGIHPAWQPAAVGGDCLYDCETSTCADYSNHSDMCVNLRAKCLAQCSAPRSNPKTPSAPPAERKISWGAIAYSSKEQSAGVASGKDDRASAEKEAMDICARRGRSCAVKAGFNKGCGALAADGDFVGAASSTAQHEAEQKAVEECKRSGGKRCVLHVSLCSF